MEYLRDGSLEQAAANAEVIVCADAIDSPRLLLSGVGPADHLRDVGIEVVADLPGVGRNLHDHLLLGIVYEASRQIPPPAANLAESSMFWRSDDRLPGPNLHFMFIHVPFHPPTLEAPENSYTVAVGLLRPASRGRIKLNSVDPDDPPLINPNYLDDADVRTLLLGIEKAHELHAADAFAEWRAREVLPGGEAPSEVDLRDFIARGASTYYHPVGSCRMGVDEAAVVDPELDGLRVADASIMPTIVSAITNPSSVMIGEKAADLVRRAGRVPGAGDAAQTA